MLFSCLCFFSLEALAIIGMSKFLLFFLSIIYYFRPKDRSQY